MHAIRAGLKTGARLLVCTALLVGLVGTAPAAAVGRATATEALNVRSGPGTTHRVLGTLREGQQVTALASSKGWTTIEYRDAKAYVASTYLRQAAAPAPVVSSPALAAGSLRATTTAVNVRTGAGTSHGVLRVLTGGARVTLTGRSSGGFAQVVLGSRTGWVGDQLPAGGDGAAGRGGHPGGHRCPRRPLDRGRPLRPRRRSPQGHQALDHRGRGERAGAGRLRRRRPLGDREVPRPTGRRPCPPCPGCRGSPAPATRRPRWTSAPPAPTTTPPSARCPAAPP